LPGPRVEAPGKVFGMRPPRRRFFRRIRYVDTRAQHGTLRRESFTRIEITVPGHVVDDCAQAGTSRFADGHVQIFHIQTTVAAHIRRCHVGCPPEHEASPPLGVTALALQRLRFGGEPGETQPSIQDHIELLRIERKARMHVATSARDARRQRIGVPGSQTRPASQRQRVDPVAPRGRERVLFDPHIELHIDAAVIDTAFQRDTRRALGRERVQIAYLEARDSDLVPDALADRKQTDILELELIEHHRQAAATGLGTGTQLLAQRQQAFAVNLDVSDAQVAELHPSSHQGTHADPHTELAERQGRRVRRAQSEVLESDFASQQAQAAAAHRGLQAETSESFRHGGAQNPGRSDDQRNDEHDDNTGSPEQEPAQQ
jgi:hypothetical protein